MKVIAFSLSLFQPLLKGSKDPLSRVSSHQLSFRNSDFGEEHAAPNFLEGTWRGFLVLMECSWKTPPRIASLRLDKFAYSQRKSISPAQAGEKNLPRMRISSVRMTYGPMSIKMIQLTRLIVLAISFGLTFFVAFLSGTLTMNSALDMVLELLRRASEVMVNTISPLGPLV